jgi:HlyD family secretion protein
MAKPKNRLRIILFLVFCALVLAAAGVFIFFKTREQSISIQADKVMRRNITELVVANGKIQPVLQVKISPEVSGEIIQLPVKEGQAVKKGDLLLKIKPDAYIAGRNQAEAAFKSSVAGRATAEATLHKAEAEYKRNQDLLRNKLISDSAFDEAKASFEVASAQLSSSEHQVEMAKASLDSAEDALSKTTIVSPLDGVITKLNSELGERVLGTVQNVGTEIMTVSDLNEMEARVDVGEVDVVLMKPKQVVRLEVDAFKDKKFSGTITEIANSSTTAGLTSGMSSGNSQEATKFAVKIRIKEKEQFRPGMSCTAEIETRYRTNVLTVPIASVTTRIPKEKNKKLPTSSNPIATAAQAETLASSGTSTNNAKGDKKAAKPIEVVFVLDGERAKMVPVKIGISDDSYWEITDGLKEGQEIVSGSFRAVSHDLDEGKRVKKGARPIDSDKPAGSEKPD